MIVGVIYPICTFLLCVLLCVSELLKLSSFRSSWPQHVTATDRNILVNFLQVEGDSQNLRLG